MRKHIVIVSEESVLSGHYKCGIGEVVDTLASALRKYYDVTIVTIGNRRGGRAGGTITLGTEGETFYEEAALTVNALEPDLVHNFASPALIDLLEVDCPKVLTFDRWEEDAAGHLDVIPKYDHVTTLSTAYANEMMAAHPEAAAWPLKGIIAGIDAGYYSVSGVWSHSNPRKSYYRYLDREDQGKPLMVSMGRLIPVKGIQDIIDSAQAIADAGMELVIYGTGDAAYEEQLQALSDAGVLTYYRRMTGYGEMMQALSAADYYLMPSYSEVCGLQPMKAARMGAVPIVRPVGGMAENFDETTAILITSSLSEAVERAAALSAESYAELRENGLKGSWTWETRVLPWVELYGLPTAPQSETAFTRTVGSTVGNVTAVNDEPVARPCPFARKESADNE